MLQLYDTLTREKHPFVPVQAGHIGLYVCGVTVYDYCHIGHARVMVVFDALRRFLQAAGWQVRYVRNITDVDDKIIARAKHQGEPIDALTARMIEAMHEDERNLGLLPPDIEPRVTQHIDEIITLIEALVRTGHAYPASNGDVYYRVNSFPRYGLLSKQNLEQLRAGARVEVNEQKENPLDFVLWKASREAGSWWPSPWGDGRPGWHVECSAMSRACLGATLDIHGGGPDLPFPHHENEIAQSEAANGCTYANTWMHVGALRIHQEKMSKSLSNALLIRDILMQHDPEVVRFFLLSAHYRSSLDYSDSALENARRGLHRLYTALDQVAKPYGDQPNIEDFMAVLADDFNTPRAIALLFTEISALNAAVAHHSPTVADIAGRVVAMGKVLGILQREPGDFLRTEHSGVPHQAIEALLAERRALRQRGDYAAADRVRQQLAAMGVAIKDTVTGSGWTRMK